MIQTLLIANRGEIACRIMRTCRRLGIRTVAVYSEADKQARHVQEADEAIYLGPSPASESYLAIECLIAAAKRAGADAVHPGFGFLAETSDFARACVVAGLIFVGPTAVAIATMGNKRAARELVAAHGVPILPGSSGTDLSETALLAVAEQIGYPLMVKAAAGGGGKGLRWVATAVDLPAALASAKQEALAAFGSDELLLEKALLAPRHIEVQIFGDQYGQIIHLGERDCSVQRHHQKVIEEAPAVGLTAELRQKLGATAVRVAQTVPYSNAGTVEFLLDADGSFYFLEMNTRLQVEHPVTECITGLDLVEWQLRVAEGEPLPLTQSEIRWQGHAIEARIYAENPASGFLPVTGRVALWREPAGEGVRVESGLLAEDEISVYYDPMVAKVIAHGPDRPTARRRLLRALAEARLLGITNNIAFLQTAVAHPTFVAGSVTTQFISDHLANWTPSAPEPTRALLAAAVGQYWQDRAQQKNGIGYWRNSPNRPLLYPFAQQPTVALLPQGDDFACTVAGQHYHVQAQWVAPHELALTVDGHRSQVTVLLQETEIWLATAVGTLALTPETLLPRPQPAASASGSLRAPGSLRAAMPGIVLAVLVKVGQTVAKDQPLLKLEAMKMEYTIVSGAAGVVTAVYYQPGDQVAAEAQLVMIEEKGMS